jgi:predicted NBD/HSP70 family sugar kinase
MSDGIVSGADACYRPAVAAVPTERRPGAGAVLRLIREGSASTRAEVARRTGLGRVTVAQRVDALLRHGLVVEASDGRSTGGRPPARLVFNEDAGMVLTADLGATHARVAVTNLAGTVLAEVAHDLAVADGPDAVLPAVESHFDRLLSMVGRPAGDVRAIGLGVPGPVEFASGRPVSPPIMPGWDRHPVPERLRRFGVPVLVDNDVNIMAMGEHRSAWRDRRHLVFVKVGTGIGAGIVAQGAIHRGARGAAGDIGHVRVPGFGDLVCACGNTGCLEAVAGGAALVRRTRELGYEAADSRDVVALARGHCADVVRLVREAGRVLGTVLASLVNALNPELIVIGGDLAAAHEQLFAGVREAVYQRSTPLATRHLEIVPSALGDRAGITGASVLALEHILAPEQVDALVQGVDASVAAALR